VIVERPVIGLHSIFRIEYMHSGVDEHTFLNLTGTIWITTFSVHGVLYDTRRPIKPYPFFLWCGPCTFGSPEDSSKRLVLSSQVYLQVEIAQVVLT
jgi:hypothetical protein